MEYHENPRIQKMQRNGECPKFTTERLLTPGDEEEGGEAIPDADQFCMGYISDVPVEIVDSVVRTAGGFQPTATILKDYNVAVEVPVLHIRGTTMHQQEEFRFRVICKSHGSETNVQCIVYVGRSYRTASHKTCPDLFPADAAHGGVEILREHVLRSMNQLPPVAELEGKRIDAKAWDALRDAGMFQRYVFSSEEENWSSLDESSEPLPTAELYLLETHAVVLQMTQRPTCYRRYVNPYETHYDQMVVAKLRVTHFSYGDNKFIEFLSQKAYEKINWAPSLYDGVDCNTEEDNVLWFMGGNYERLGKDSPVFGLPIDVAEYIGSLAGLKLRRDTETVCQKFREVAAEKARRELHLARRIARSIVDKIIEEVSV